jgi:hypothetical protein
MRLRLPSILVPAIIAAPLACGGGGGGPQARKDTPVVIHVDRDPDGALVLKTAVDPKPLADPVKKGLVWLAKHQLENGAWGQGDESAEMGGGTQMRAASSVADTSVALLAFLRSGSSARSGEYQQVVARGLDFVLEEVEQSDTDSMYVTAVRGTRVQYKIGQYVDTFAALNVFTEAKDRMADGVQNARVDAAIKKIVHKLEKNQMANGQWASGGWAPVLSQALAAKGLNRASAIGAQVSKQTLEKVEQAASAPTIDGTAGVEVYGASAKSSGLRDTAARKKAKVDDMKQKKAAYDAAHHSPDVPTQAQIDEADKDAKKSIQFADDNEKAMIGRFQDPRFISGFGSNGGEEYLSYLLISETMVQKGGDEWKKWDAAITGLVDKVQNDDGSWTGHHCITGRTFCTAAALLVLMGDRTPAMVAIAK